MIVGDADDGPAPLPAANGATYNSNSLGDDDLPPDFDAMPIDSFETKPATVVGDDATAVTAAGVADAAAVETMEVD